MAFASKINSASSEFAGYRAAMLALVERLRELEARAVALSEQRRDHFEKRGQITPRARLARLLDVGMPFLQLHTVAGYLVDTDDPDKTVPGSSVVLGIGYVGGRRCAIWVDDSGIKAGAISTYTLPAVLSLQQLALRHKLPLIHLVESAGANLMEYQVEMWANGGAMFYNLARLSAQGIPTVAVLHGPSTAGGAYMPGLSDYVIGVKNNGMAALAGAALVAAATGEQANDRELGGSEMHARQTGLVEYLAEDDIDALAIAREVVGRISNPQPASEIPFEEPRYPVEELAGAVPLDYREPYDVREVIARLVDASDFSDFKPDYGVATVCVQASIYGIRCGVVGNNGPIDPDGATKATHFFQLCDQADMPLVFLSNTTGYMVGTEYEQSGMIKHGSKMIQAVSNVRVPKITLYIGASFGAGNYGMSGLAFEPDFLFSWPNALTGVMGGEQAASTMSMVARLAAKRRSEEPDEKRLAARHQQIAAHFDRQSDAFYTSGRCLDHGVIDPRDSRKVLGFCLQTCREGRERKMQPNSFGVARG